MPLRIHQVGNRLVMEHSPSHDGHNVYPHCKTGMLLSAQNGILEGFTSHHQAAAGEEPFPVSTEYRCIDFPRRAVVIGMDDQPGLPCHLLRGNHQEHLETLVVMREPCCA